MSLLLLAALVLGPADAAHALAAGDEAFLRIDYPAAVSAYEAARADLPSEPGVLWRLARVYVCMGEVAEEDDAGRLFRAGEAYARQCIREDSMCAEGHAWLAGALGYLALSAGPSAQLRLSRELLQEIDETLRLDSTNDIAYSIRGSFYRALGNTGWVKRQIASLLFGDVPEGGYEDAEVALKKAIALAPHVMRHRYELGVLYLDWGRPEEARQQLEAAASLPARVAIDRPRMAKIHELLTTLGQRR